MHVCISNHSCKFYGCYFKKNAVKRPKVYMSKFIYLQTVLFSNVLTFIFIQFIFKTPFLLFKAMGYLYMCRIVVFKNIQWNKWADL